MDGVSPVLITNRNSGNYYVAVGHRNHLRVMTVAPVLVNATSALVDFTNPTTATFGDYAQVTINNVRVLWAGDANSNNQVVNAGPNNDQNAVLTQVLTDPGNLQGSQNYVSKGYAVADLNLDGKTIASGPGNDMNVILTTVLSYPGNTGANGNYIVLEPVPTGVVVTPGQLRPSVYGLSPQLFAAEVSAVAKAERWRQGLPVPLINANTGDEIIRPSVQNAFEAPQNKKSGLFAPIPATVNQIVDGWQEKDFENLTGAFPNTNKSCIWGFTESASGGQLYIWGKAGDRYASANQSLWPAGAIKEGATPGTQLLPPNSPYPPNMVTSIICQISGVKGAKNILAEFQLWFELGDAGDSLSIQFFSGNAASTPVYRGGMEWRGANTGITTRDWAQYRIYYPDIAKDDDTIWVKWKFISDSNQNTARGPWLDDLSVSIYQKPATSNGCQTTTAEFAPGLSKGLNVPPYAEDIKNGEPVKIASMANRLTASDVDWVRLEFQFHPNSLTNLQDQPINASEADGYNHIDYRHYDRIIDRLCAASPRIAVLGLLTNQTLVRQDWKVENGDGFVGANFYVQDFIKVTEEIARYYDDRISFWEVWNEPDNRERRLSVEEYVILLYQTYQTIKRVESTDQVVLGGLGSADSNAYNYAVRAFNRLRSSSPRPFDIFALHPYHSIEYKNDGGQVENDPGYYMRAEKWLRPSTIIKKFRQELDGNSFSTPEKGKAIWATELGWNSSKGTMNCPNYLQLVVNEAEQACYLQRGFHSLFNLSPTVSKVFWYQYHDTGQSIKQSDCGAAGQSNNLNVLPSPSWVASDVARYFLYRSDEPRVVIPWGFGLYNGNIGRDDLSDSQKAKPVQIAFKNWPSTDACMNNFPDLPAPIYTTKALLPLVRQQQDVSQGQ